MGYKFICNGNYSSSSAVATDITNSSMDNKSIIGVAHTGDADEMTIIYGSVGGEDEAGNPIGDDIALSAGDETKIKALFSDHTPVGF